MILRRVIEHVRKQEWTAIALDFVIVVFGVFFGIQVSNWNEQRATDRKADAFTERLHEDLRAEVWNFNALAAYHRDVLANARRTLPALEGNTELSNDALIIAAYRATQYGEVIAHRETYDELTSTGNIGLIEERLLRKIAAGLYNSDIPENLKNEGINSRFRAAFRMNIPIDIQEAIAKACGDRPLMVGSYKSLTALLDYDCKTGLPQRAIDQAASTLRSDPSYVPLLRLRIADLKSQLATQSMMFSQEVRAGLRAFAEDPP